MPTITEIEDYLRTTRQENPVAVKSQDRVRREVARGIKETNALKKGICNFCGKDAEKLFVTKMSVCKRCATKMIQKGGGVTIININRPVSIYCDKCHGYTFEEILINPKICEYCSLRLGRFHKFTHQEFVEKRTQDKKRMAKKLNIRNEVKKELLKGGPK